MPTATTTTGRPSTPGPIAAVLVLLVFLTANTSNRASCYFHSGSTEVSDRLANVTQTISRILDGYDIRLRPNFGGEPLFVEMDLTIASFDAISEVNMDYTITMYLNQYWTDERLSFSHEKDVLTLSGDFAEKIWVPDTFFANDKHR
ncbi:hypothetical protein TKK_0016263 [Trichogramma kaykai]